MEEECWNESLPGAKNEHMKMHEVKKPEEVGKTNAEEMESHKMDEDSDSDEYGSGPWIVDEAWEPPLQ